MAAPSKLISALKRAHCEPRVMDLTSWTELSESGEDQAEPGQRRHQKERGVGPHPKYHARFARSHITTGSRLIASTIAFNFFGGIDVPTSPSMFFPINRTATQAKTKPMVMEPTES
jgi:hypothetical protein